MESKDIIIGNMQAILEVAIFQLPNIINPYICYNYSACL